jgi:carbon-monoxide dehydrogenase medium subunit
MLRFAKICEIRPDEAQAGAAGPNRRYAAKLPVAPGRLDQARVAHGTEVAGWVARMQSNQVLSGLEAKVVAAAGTAAPGARRSERAAAVEADEAEERATSYVHPLAVHRSRKRIAPFRLHVPTNAAAALALLRKHPGACVVAGGIDVINRMKAGEAADDVVYIGRIGFLRRIEASPHALEIGACCTHHELAVSPVVSRAIPALASVWGSIANPRIRHKGTVGGNLMANQPDYEGPAILAALDARLRFITQAEVRDVACTEYFAARQRDPMWLLQAVLVPCERRIHLDYDRSLKGVAGVVLALFLDGDMVVSARAAVSWAYREVRSADLPIGSAALPAALARRAPMLARTWVSALPEPMSNHLASGGYRRRIIEIHLRRALERAARGHAA